MSADVIRWMFCRQNPAANINFGPGPANELRSRFILKLWNAYAFFCDNARQVKGGFDLTAAPVPVKERPDIDRWLLSELQALVRTAHEEFPRFNVMAFCDSAETFVDGYLSNWYIRRNKDRFWGDDKSQDKLAAFQTLWTVLVTLAKLFAPIMPFLSEVMYRNLVAEGQDAATSVHLCDFPKVDETLVEEKLSAETEAMLEVVRLAHQARNSVRIRVRQVLAELRVQSKSPTVRAAVERFRAIIAEELNVKRVSLQDPEAGDLLRIEVRPNMKNLGPKFGPRLNEVQAAIKAANPAELAAKAQGGQPWELPCPGGPVTLDPADVVVSLTAPEGWAGASDRDTQVALDVRLTPELVAEGLAREVIRHVQSTRKDAELEIEDRIELYLATDANDLQQAIETHRDYIGSETLVARWAAASLNGQAHVANVRVDGRPLTIQLRRL